MDELKVRVAVARACVQILQDLADDPRQPDALAHYQAQRDKLEAELAQAIRPPDIVIGLKAARLFGDVPKQGEY